MSFDWEQYLLLACELNGTATNPCSQEAKIRSSISRAYYGAMCLTRNYLLDRGELRAPVNNMHQDVLDRLFQDRAPERRQIANRLNRMKRLRHKADYKDQFDDAAYPAPRVIKQAQQVINTLAKRP